MGDDRARVNERTNDTQLLMNSELLQPGSKYFAVPVNAKVANHRA
jgi:hypothetical protein